MPITPFSINFLYKFETLKMSIIVTKRQTKTKTKNTNKSVTIYYEFILTLDKSIQKITLSFYKHVKICSDVNFYFLWR